MTIIHTTTTREYDNNGKLTRETIDSVETNDSANIYPSLPYRSNDWYPQRMVVTCQHTNPPGCYGGAGGVLG